MSKWAATWGWFAQAIRVFSKYSYPTEPSVCDKTPAVYTWLSFKGVCKVYCHYWCFSMIFDNIQVLYYLCFTHINIYKNYLYVTNLLQFAVNDLHFTCKKTLIFLPFPLKNKSPAPSAAKKIRVAETNNPSKVEWDLIPTDPVKRKLRSSVFWYSRLGEVSWKHLRLFQHTFGTHP